MEIAAISTNFRHNEQIRISPIFLIDENDNKVGSTSTAEALRKARDSFARGEAAMFVKEDDVDGMAGALREVRKGDMRRRLRSAGLEQAKKSSWGRTARQVRDALERVASSIEVARASRP